MLMALNKLKDRIEQMDKYHQIEILRILNGFSTVKTNENKNGTFINLTELSFDVLTALEKYADYVDEQQTQLKKIETEKNKLEQNFFT
jgi:hypothetical protein